MAMVAKDTFVTDLADGSTRRVARGEIFPDSHELVRRDKDGILFGPFEIDEGEPAAPAKPAARRGAARKET